jgi:hypothetical protein
MADRIHRCLNTKKQRDPDQEESSKYLLVLHSRFSCSDVREVTITINRVWLRGQRMWISVQSIGATPMADTESRPHAISSG